MPQKVIQLYNFVEKGEHFGQFAFETKMFRLEDKKYKGIIVWYLELEWYRNNLKFGMV